MAETTTGAPAADPAVAPQVAPAVTEWGDHEESVYDLLDPQTRSPSMRALDEEAERERAENPKWKGFSVMAPEKVIEALPLEGKKLVHGLRQMVSRATAAAAEERRAAAAALSEAKEIRAAAERERERVRASLADPSLLAAPAQGEEQEPDRTADPYAWFAWETRRVAREQVRKDQEAFQANIRAKMQEEAAALEAQRAQMEHTARVEELQVWIDRTPALEDDAVFDAVKAKLAASEYKLRPEDALTLVLHEQGKLGKARTTPAAAIVRRPSATQVSAAIPPLEDASDEGVLEYMRQNPTVPRAKVVEMALRGRQGP